jgi:hypothetical protein
MKGHTFAAAAALAMTAGGAHAQAYPVKPVRLIVPLAPGGPSDILARTVAAKLSESIGQSVVVENRAGARRLGRRRLRGEVPARRLHDHPGLEQSCDQREPLSEAAVRHAARPGAGTMLASAPYILTVHPTLPVKSTGELIALAKSRPGELNYASGGSGTGPHNGDGAAEAADRHEDDARSVQGRGTGARRHDGRPDPGAHGEHHRRAAAGQ